MIEDRDHREVLSAVARCIGVCCAFVLTTVTLALGYGATALGMTSIVGRGTLSWLLAWLIVTVVICAAGLVGASVVGRRVPLGGALLPRARARRRRCSSG